jgi:hypothetical protein
LNHFDYSKDMGLKVTLNGELIMVTLKRLMNIMALSVLLGAVSTPAQLNAVTMEQGLAALGGCTSFIIGVSTCIAVPFGYALRRLPHSRSTDKEDMKLFVGGTLFAAGNFASAWTAYKYWKSLRN